MFRPSKSNESVTKVRYVCLIIEAEARGAPMRVREDILTLVMEFFEVARPSRSGGRLAATR